MKLRIVIFVLVTCLKMNAQELNGLYPMVLPKPNDGFENRYYEILDNGLYELDTETRDATELIDNSILPVLVDEIPKVGIDSNATKWAELIYFDLLAGKRCVYEDEFWEIFYKRLPDFTGLKGAKQEVKEYLEGFDLSEFLGYLKNMPIYRLNTPNPAIPNYNMMGKGYYPENSSDWINFDRFAILKCISSLNEESKSILSRKYLMPTETPRLVAQIKNDIEKLKIKQAGNEPNGHLIIEYEIGNRSFLYDTIRLHILEDFMNWLSFWSSKGYPIGLNIQFLLDR
jgi:hypothetical protein